MLDSIAISSPEPFELLIYGVTLVIVAVILRSSLAKIEKPKFDEEAVTEA